MNHTGTRARPRARRAMVTAAALAALTALGACGADGPTAGLLLPRHRAAPAVVPAADRAAAATATTALGADLYRTVAPANTDGGDLVLSPAGLADVLGMLLPGARGRTADGIATAAHTTLPAGRFAAALGGLASAQTAHAAADHTDLRRSTALWTDPGTPATQSYLRTLDAAFGTGVRTADFAHHPGEARDAVNGLVSRETDGLVPALMPADAITNRTRLVLTDALYLKAPWAQPFDPSRTADAPFHPTPRTTLTARTMHDSDGYRYAAAPGWQAVELPYRGGRLAMDVVMPANGTLPAFRRSLTGARLTAMLGALRPTQVDLSLPTFSFTYGAALNAPLTKLGMGAAFGSRADLDGIATGPERPRAVGVVVQKAGITVDEEGTTAVAGTGAGAVAGAVAEPPATAMTVDHPFVFVIRDLTSGQPLFMGQVTAPRG